MYVDHNSVRPFQSCVAASGFKWRESYIHHDQRVGQLLWTMQDKNHNHISICMVAPKARITVLALQNTMVVLSKFGYLMYDLL